jgi:hypothetical protein
MAGPKLTRLVEFACPARVRQLLAASNVEVVRRRKGAIVEIHLLEHGNDFRLRSRKDNPQALVHRAETDENPRRVWALKKMVDVTTPAAE